MWDRSHDEEQKKWRSIWEKASRHFRALPFLSKTVIARVGIGSQMHQDTDDAVMTSTERVRYTGRLSVLLT